jgi:O-antigen ligase
MDSVLSQRLPTVTANDGRVPPVFLQNAMFVLVELIGFSIPVSTSLSEITTSLFILCWFVSGNWRERTRVIAANPVALLSLAMFSILLLATTWSSATWLQAGRCLLKYREFLYLPLLVPIFQDPRLKTAGMRGFTVGAVGMLLLSYFEWLSGVDVGLASSHNDYVIAKDRIIHSLLMALLVYFSAQELVRGGRFRWLYGAVIALAAPNILFLVQGRTGYLLLGLLTTLFMIQRFGRKGLVCACLLVGASAWGAYASSETVRARVAQTISQIRNQFGYPKQHSWDPRLEYYEHTLTLIGRHPLRGTGTGSFSGEYAKLARTAGVEPTSDPHNEYLHLAVQAGLPAAAMFVLLLAVQWHCAGRLPTWDSRIGRGVVLAIAVGSLFNSLILSITGGLAWSYFSALAFADLNRDADGQTETSPQPLPAASEVITTRAA